MALGGRAVDPAARAATGLPAATTAALVDGLVAEEAVVALSPPSHASPGVALP